MKKATLLSLSISLIALTACEKTYVCSCKASSGLYTKEARLVKTTYPGEKAKTACDSKVTSPGEKCFPTFSH